MYVLSWNPGGTQTTVETWTDVLSFLATLAIPCKSIALMTSRTKTACETQPERILVLLDEAGSVTSTLTVGYRPVPVGTSKDQGLQP